MSPPAAFEAFQQVEVPSQGERMLGKLVMALVELSRYRVYSSSRLIDRERGTKVSETTGPVQADYDEWLCKVD